jgi:hypothetical protein
MQKAFASPDRNLDTLPSSEEIAELQTDYANMLSAIINLLDGAKYLWKENIMSNNIPIYRFGMYEPSTDSVIINAGENSVLVIGCAMNTIKLWCFPNRMILPIYTGWLRIHRYFMRNWLLRRTDFNGM